MIRRKHLKVGMLVEIETNNQIIRGYIKQVIPPKQPNQPIEVELKSGVIGIIDRIVTTEDVKQESFKFFNLFFHSKHLLTIHHKFTKDIYSVNQTGYIFSEESIAIEVLRELNNDNLAIRRISRQKPLLENFKNTNINKFRLNEERIVTTQKLKSLEIYFESNQ